jgi:hypothetical protein
MWMLVNRTAYAVGRNWVRDKDGVHHWLVAVRGTFEIGSAGRLRLADEQPPPPLEPVYHGDPGKSSLRTDSDLLAVKSGTDVVVEGSAHAPKGRPAPTVPVAFRIGEIEKSLIVHGPRVYYQSPMGLTTTRPQPFTTQPIRYEAAFGGTDLTDPDPRQHRIDSRNPVGRGIASRSRRLENELAHAVEYPNKSPEKAGPAGFGPIASYWSPRLEYGGTYDKRWEETKKPLLPDDYDERFAMSAPEDQRPSRPLRGGETMVLLNLTPDGGLSFELPKVFLAFRTFFGRRIEEHRATLTTVAVDTETSRLSLTWQGDLRVPASEVDYLDATFIMEKQYV